jgi:hypothetical protein
VAELHGIGIDEARGEPEKAGARFTSAAGDGPLVMSDRYQLDGWRRAWLAGVGLSINGASRGLGHGCLRA